MENGKKSNDNKSNSNNRRVNMTNRKWLIIEKTNYGNSGDSFSITKTADTVEQATKFKIHLDALNDSKNKTYFIASDVDTVMARVISLHNKKVEEEKPLILTDEVKNTSTEMPF
jgi:hypothetical protein